jgi:hypothetical protein
MFSFSEFSGSEPAFIGRSFPELPRRGSPIAQSSRALGETVLQHPVNETVIPPRAKRFTVAVLAFDVLAPGASSGGLDAHDPLQLWNKTSLRQRCSHLLGRREQVFVRASEAVNLMLHVIHHRVHEHYLR